MRHLQGRIHQVEYAMEAVKQGSATVGLKSKTHAILVALKVSNLMDSYGFSLLKNLEPSIVVIPHLKIAISQYFNSDSFLASGGFCCLLKTFENSLDPDQDRHSVGPDLDPNCLTL